MNRMNQITQAVNDEDYSWIDPPLTEEEIETYNKSVQEKKDMEKRYGRKITFVPTNDIDIDDETYEKLYAGSSLDFPLEEGEE